MSPRILLAFISCLLINSLHSQNLITNGDFESGNGVGFQTSYNYTNPGTGQANSSPRQYAIVNNPYLLNTNNFVNSGDHTSGTGLMMVCDGADGQSEIFWKTNGDIALQAGQTYRFKFFIRSVNATNPQPVIGLRIMAAAATYFNQTYTVTDPTTGWQEVNFQYTVSEPGSPNRRFELYNVNQSAVGNDFAVDDISLRPLAALSLTYSAVNSSCFGANNGSIVVYGVGGSLTYTSYSITGPVNQTNATGIFSNLPPGTYTISVTDNTPTTATLPNIIITQPANLTISPNTAICPGTSTTLTASGGTTYNWTAVPVDPSMSSTTGASITVSPTATTTYTVSSSETTTRNLVFNGDFSQGNIGFTSEYQYFTPVVPIPAGIQGAYGVVTNPQAWFAGFTACTDHTTGTGNMLVADGSVANAGNDKIWCQKIPVTAGQNYTFSYWIQTVATPNPANIEVLINGVSVGVDVAPATTCGWVQHTYTWNSGAATLADICIFDRVITASGNDFAIDDISFTSTVTCTRTRSVVVSIANATFGTDDTICPGSSGTLTFTGTPGAIVIFTSSTGASYNVLLSAAGTASWPSPILNVTTIYSLQSIFLPSTGCSSPLSGTVTFTVEANGCATVLTGGLDVNDPNIPPSCEPGACIDLSAAYVDLGSTTSYAVSQIEYCPYPFFGAPPEYNIVDIPTGGVNTDDFWSDVINLPFDFCFFGQVYSSCNAGTNGVLSFNPQVFGAFCPWNLGGLSVPNAAFPIRNAIYGVYQDTDFRIVSPAASPPERLISWRLEGVYPCRKLIVNFYHMGQFQCLQSVGLQTSQIILYEISNIIEVNVETRTPCNSWNTPNGAGVIGIQNMAGTLGYTPPGRNTGNWTTTNEAWRFTPNGPSATTFQWLDENGATISTNTNIVVCPTVTTTYTAEVTYNQCGQIYTVSSPVTVTVYPDDTQSPIDLTECGNPFDLTENDATILGSLNPSDYEINYFLTQTDAELGTNIITNPTSFNSTSNPQTIYAGIQNFNTGCNLVKEFELIISSCNLDPQPNPLSSCDDNPVDGFTLFDLTQSDTAALNGLDPTLYTVTYHNSQADANTGNAPITPATAYNGFNGEIVYVRVEENAAPTTFGTTSFALTINPTPSIADVVQTICSGDTFTVTPTNTAPDVVPTGTTYTWTVAAPAGITGASNQATAQTSISQTLSNTTSTSLTAIYTVTASVGTAPNICTDTFDITVTVNPKPSIADVTQAICTGNTFTVTPTNTAPDVVPTGTTYTWTVTTPAGITGASNQATAQTSISQTLTNATSNSIVVTYTVTASFGTAPNSCTDTFTINVTVNPEPQIADVVQTICSGDTFTVTPSNTAPDVVPTGTTYTWTVAAPAGITGASNQATAQTSISQTLTNTTSTSLSAIYTVTASVGTAPNICTDTFDITVTVNPKPSIADVTQAICTGNTFTVTPTNTAPDVVPTGTTYTWTVVAGAVTGASDQATAQTSISQTLTNATSNSIVVTYTVTASFGTAPNVCTDTFTIGVTVNPEPQIADVVQTICSGDTFTVTPTNTAPDVVPTGTTYTWTVAAAAGITGASNQATAQTSISQTLTNTTSTSLSAIYTVTASVGTAPNICTDTFDITVTVNPKPSIADVTQAICTGNTFTVTPTNTAPDVVPTGTTYTWTVTTPAGITGASNQATAQTSISQTLSNSTSNSIVVTYTVTASFGTAPNVCTDTFTIAVTVNPEPSIADVVQTICSGDTFTVTPTNTAPNVVPTGTTYTWTVATPAGITGASNQATAQTSISQTLTNTTLGSLSAIYTVTASAGTAPNICTDTFDITVTVNPNPSIADVTQTICSGDTFTVTPTNTAPDVVPTGTTYTWTVAAPAGITGASNQATAQTSISQTLNNTTSSAINVVYTVTASFGTAPNVCTDTFTIAVTVNPNPSIANKTQTICSGTTFTVTPTNTAPDVVPTGTTYTWSVAAAAGITGASNQATAQTSISQTLINTTSTNLDAVYTVTATFGTAPNSCSSSFNITVTVIPNPTITDVTQTICSTGTFTVTPTNTAPDVVPTGTTYTWTVATPAGITGASNQGTAQTSISQTLTNTTSSAINVVYTVTASVGTAPTVCTDTFTITITVNPKPSIANKTQTICSGTTFSVTPTDTAPDVVPTGTTYTWTVAAPAGISGASNQATAQTAISQTLSNTTNAAISAVYTVTAFSGVAPNVCTNTFIVTVTVNPNPVIANKTQTICSTGTFTVTPTNTAPDVVPTGTTYTWTVTAGAGITGASNQATAQTSISQTLTNTTSAPINVIYAVTASSGTAPNSCTGTFIITVTVNPKPSIANKTQAICSTETFTVSPIDGVDVVPMGTTYTWTVTAPAGITGASNQATGQVNISQTLTNTTTAPIDVIYTVTASFGLAPNVCTSTFIVTVTVNPLPTASIAGTITICPSTEATITFTGTANATVEYTVNGGGVQTLDLDASGFGSITETFTITTTYVLVGVFSSGTPVCSVLLNQSATVSVLPAPLINMPADLVNCDDNNDGISIFDLTQTIAFITGGNPNVTVTFHETADDALLGGAPIQTPSNYTSIDPNIQTIYVRVVNTGTTDCPSVTSFNLIVNPYPVINLTPADYQLCDLNSDTQEEFDLTTTIPNILGTLNPALHTVTFYETQAEAEAGTPQITGVTTYTTVTHTVWVRVTINATGCYSVVPLELIVNPLPIANIPTPLSLCDVNNPGDQQEAFDMTLAIPDIVGTQVGMQVTFHLTLAQAQAGTNALPTTYTNTSNVQPIHVRVFDPVTGCFSTTILDLRVEPLPLLFPIGPTVLCDDNNDGIASFDLAALVSTLLNGASPSDITVTFHETEQQAQDGSDVIDTTVLYQTIDEGQQTLYVRAQDNATGCVSVRAIVLVVNPRPEMPTLPNLTQCDTDSNTQNGLSTFDLSVQTPVILAAQSGAASGYQVRYFTTEQNAIDNVSWIATPNSYPSTSNPQIIWVRVTHLTSGCYRTGSFELIVNIPLALTFPTPLSLCDESLPNDQFTVFDLTVRTNEITQGLGNYTVVYYPSYQNALDNVNAIQNPAAYTNATAAVQTLGVRVTSAEGCHSYTTLTIRVLPLPEPLTDPLPIEACDDNNPGDGIETFDLTLRAVYILNGASQTEFALTYYETEADANAGTNAIADPTNYTSTIANTQTIWVRVTRIPGVNEPSCYQLVQLQLIVNPLPVIAESPIAFYQCEPIDDYTMAFVLSTMNPRVLGSTQSASDYTVSYYLTAADALAGTPQLPNVYTNISSPQTIYVRVENNLTGCVNATGEVILEVEEGTQANAIPVNAPETTQCDTIGDNDGIYTFDLSGGVTPILIGTNNPTGTVVYYYESLSAAQLATTSNDYSGAIATPSAYNNTMPQHQTLYAVLVNPATNSKCPTITPVELTVFLLPEPTPEGGTICLDPETGALLNDYTLESNLNPLTHTFVWTNAAGTVMGTGASLTVTEPDVYTVVATHIATGCVSEAVTAAVVHSQQATLTYVVSNYFTDNQTITVIATGTTIPNQNNDNYLYSIDYGPFQVSNVFTNVGFGWHDITVQDTNGCLDATIRAFVINYPRFFTPNGDQQNDTWNIFSLREVNPNAKIYIFDRYGKFIKQISPMGVGWDGTFNGEALPSTDYWFTVEYEENGESKIFKAHFSLKR